MFKSSATDLHNDGVRGARLQQVFPAGARGFALSVHIKGKGICGAYTYEIAETKVETVHAMAQENGFPLRATIEEG